MQTRDHFHEELMRVFLDAMKEGRDNVDVSAGELHRSVGGYPGPDHRMPVCCSVMRSEFSAKRDSVLQSPPSGDGAGLTIRFALPRTALSDKRATTADVSTEEGRGKTRCNTCLEPIWIGAQKCTHCDSYQDWRRVFGFSSTVLALMVSLIAVLGATVPKIVDLFSAQDSKLQLAQHPIFEGGHLYVMATNKGTKDGVVEFATMTIDTDHPKYIWLHVVRLDPKSAVVSPGETKDLDYRAVFPTGTIDKLVQDSAWFPSQVSKQELEQLKNKKCTLKVRVRSFKGEKRDERLDPSSCADFFQTLEGYWSDAHKTEIMPTPDS
jgi:hypothetical protein